MKIVVLMENTAAREDLSAAHGLSLYIETPKHRILMDMGPNDDYLKNAAKLGVDLAQVDIAILSHGHYDHGGGLKAFCQLNDHAKIYVRENAFGDYWSLADGNPHYIGIDQSLDRSRFVLTGEETVIDEELTLFAAVPDTFGALSASAKLREKAGEEFLPDLFSHEQDLLVTFQNAYEALAPGGHLLFDMNTEYKLSQVLGDNFYYDLGEDECYLWENEYDPDRGVCRFDLTFFAKETDGRYSRIDEVHREYAYNTDRVVELLRQAGFALVTTYGDRQMSAPREREERVFFLARKQ